MSTHWLAKSAVIPLLSLVLSACVSQTEYEGVAAKNQELETQVATLQQQHQGLAAKNQQLESQLSALQQEHEGEVAMLQQQHQWVEAADMLFAPGSWELSPSGIEELNEIVPSLRSLTDVKITVYGYTDNAPVRPTLKRQGVSNNLDLSSKRAGAVVTYLASQGVDPNIMSAKGRGETHPVAPNGTPEGRAKNRRIELVLEGPGVNP